MGLNGGLQDAANLSNTLAAILLEGASDRQLDLYDRQRRTVAVEFVQHQSIENKRNLEARDPAIRARHLADLRDTAADPVRARQFLLRTSMIASQRRAAAVGLEDARDAMRASAGGPVT
jgi:3-(3-hydroxy-phenyl)propionate hydroxylase